MELVITGKNMEISDRIRGYVEKKTDKLDRYLPRIDEALVELRTEGAKSSADRHVVQLTVRVRGTILRAEERATDVFTAIDAVLDKMYRQIMRYKTRGRGRRRVQEEGLMPPVEEPEEETQGGLSEPNVSSLLLWMRRRPRSRWNYLVTISSSFSTAIRGN